MNNEDEEVLVEKPEMTFKNGSYYCG